MVVHICLIRGGGQHTRTCHIYLDRITRTPLVWHKLGYWDALCERVKVMIECADSSHVNGQTELEYDANDFRLYILRKAGKT